MDNETFDSWAIVELFGHSQIAGRVSEQVIAGQAFIRVDVPGFEDAGDGAFTRFFGGTAVYSITPVSEAVARMAADQMRVKPVSVYMMPGLRLTSEPDEDEWLEKEEEDGSGAI